MRRVLVVIVVLVVIFYGGVYTGNRISRPGACPGGTIIHVGGAVYCYGDGVSGARVEGLYVHASDVADRFASQVAGFRTTAVAIDAGFYNSAQETGGTRHVRYAVDPGSCTFTIHDVQVSSTGDDTFSNTINEVAKQGYNRTDRKYILWVDANVYCGIGTVEADDQPGSANLNNGGPSYGRSDTQCWGGAEAHELGHELGAVSVAAPHTTGRYHCNDSWDRMCYNDGGPTGTQTYPCGQNSHAALYDCNHDDYFSTSPVGWLATHWNVANSVYLEQAAGSTTPNPPPPPTTTTQPPPTTTTKPIPTTTTTRRHCNILFIRYAC